MSAMNPDDLNNTAKPSHLRRISLEGLPGIAIFNIVGSFIAFLIFLIGSIYSFFSWSLFEQILLPIGTIVFLFISVYFYIKTPREKDE